ncbi:hypothetical protein N7540_005861 [Penicillium herquei]|nr:hypothetical protein N7540_005861 [Penicillium herquei]
MVTNIGQIDLGVGYSGISVESKGAVRRSEGRSGPRGGDESEKKGASDECRIERHWKEKEMADEVERARRAFMPAHQKAEAYRTAVHG